MKRSPLIILAVTLFIDLLGFGLVLPLIPVYIQHFGGASWIGGVLLASYSTMQFLFAPIWGRASDRYGRRPLILLSLSGSAITYFFFGFANSLAMLFIARVACGILTAAGIPTAQAYIADVTTPDKRASGMAVLGAAFGLGFAFGPWIGGLLSSHPILGLSPLAMPAYFAAILSACNWVWAFFKLPETHHDRAAAQEMTEKGVLDIFPAISRAVRHPTVGAQLLVFAFATFAFAAVESSFSWLIILRFQAALTQAAMHVWQTGPHHTVAFAALPAVQRQHLIEEMQTATTGRVYGIVGITVLFTQLAVMGGLARVVGENRLVMFGSLVLTASLIGIAFAPSLLFISILSACIAVGNGVMAPSLNALITHSAGPNERGTLSGVQQGMGSLSRIIAPPINNYFVDVSVPGLLLGSIPFLSSAVLMAISFFLSLRLKPLPHEARAARRHGRRGAAPTEAEAARNGSESASHAEAATPASDRP